MKQLVKLFGRQVKPQANDAPRGARRRPLRSEPLEQRQLLAGDLLAGHNYTIPEDVNGDWKVTPLDALLVLNHLGRSGSATNLEGVERGELTHLVDVTGDNMVAPLDALRVINRIARGEAVGELLQLHVNPRTETDEAFSASAFNAATRELTVGVGEIFHLEVLYSDLRSPFDRYGAFGIFADILVENPGVLEPVLTETQILKIPGEMRQAASGTISFWLEPPEGEEPGQKVTLDAETFLASQSAPAREIGNALEQLGYSDVTVTALQGDATDPFEYIIRFDGFDLADQNIPNLIAEANFFNSSGTALGLTTVTTDYAPRTSTGEINSAAVAFNLNFFSRHYKVSSQFPNGEPFYGFGGLQVGSFDAATGFLDVGGIGPILIGGYPDAGAGELPRPFDAFSIPVRMTQEVEQLRVYLDPPNQDSTRNLFYLNEPSEIPNDLIRIDLENDPTNANDGSGLLLITSVADSTEVVVVAGNGTINTTENTPATLDLSTLVTVTGSTETPTFAITSQPARGTAVLNGSVVTFTPQTDDVTTEPLTFTYSATVGSVTSTGTISVNVAQEVEVTVNAGDGTLAANQNGGPVTLNLNPLVTVTGSTATPTLAIGTQPTRGTVSISGGVVTYTPTAGQVGTDSFTYTATVGGVTDTGTINVTINPQAITVNAGDGSLTAVQNGGAQTLNLAPLVTVTGSTATPTLAIGTQPTRGTVAISGGVVTYTPTAGQVGTDSFTYTATVGGVTDTGTINVTINPQAITVNAGDGSLTAVQNGGAQTLNLAPLVTVTGSTATPTLAIGTQPTRGTVSISGGVVTYTPTAGQVGTDSFTYTATVGGVTDTGTINVTINPQAITVVAGDATLAANQDGGVRTLNLAPLVTVTGSTATPTFTIVTQGTRGTATISGGILSYTPAAGQFGSDSITYRATVNGVSDTGVIAVNIAQAEAPPVARGDNFNVVAGVTTTFTSAQLTANDSAATPNTSGQPPRVTAAAAIAGTTQGTVTFNAATGSVTYTPAAGFTGTDSFRYTITSEGQTATATVTLNVQDFVPSTISGSIFNDYIQSLGSTVRNGIRDANEPFVGGVTVQLTSPVLNQPLSRVTDGQGNYSFDTLAPGTYTVTFDVPETLIFGQRVNGSGMTVGGSDRSFVVEIPAEGGRNVANLNFTVLGKTGAAGGASLLLVSQHQNANDPDFGLATMVFDAAGTQALFELGHANEDILFAEVAVGKSGKTAILTVIMDDGSAKSAILAEEDFLVSSNQRVIHVLRNISSLTFLGSADDVLKEEYGNYRDAVDNVLASGLF